MKGLNMITDKEAKNAVDTIIQYCREGNIKGRNMRCSECTLGTFCGQIVDKVYYDIGQGFLKDFQGFKEKNDDR